MISFFRRRALKARKAAKPHRALFEPLESRRLLSADLVVDLHTTTPTSSLLPGGQPRDVIYDTTRNQLLVIDNTAVRRYDAATGQLLSSIKLAGPNGGDITPDGSYLYVALRGAAMQVYKVDLNTNGFIGVNFPDTAGLMGTHDVAVDSAGLNVLASHQPLSGGTVNHVWQAGIADNTVSDLPGGALTLDEFTVLAHSADYSYLALVSSNHDYSYSGGVISGADGRAYGTISGLAVSRDGALHAVATGTSILVEDASFSLVHQLNIAGAGVVFSPTADVLYVADPTSNMLIAFDTTSWDQISTMPIGEDLPTADPYGSGVMTLSGDGNELFLATPSGVRIFNFAAGSAFFGESVTLEADVDAMDATGLVSFIDANTATMLGQAMISGGVATLTLNNLHPAGYSVFAHYQGDSNYNPGDSAQDVLTINRAVTTWAYGAATQSNVHLSITSPTGTPDGGAVSLVENGNIPLADEILTAGQINFPVTLSLGQHWLTASYAGNSDFLPITTDETILTVSLPTTTTLTASANPIALGWPVTLTATISAGSAASGATVTFFDGTTTIGTTAVNAAGRAVLSLGNLSFGHHNVTAQLSNYGQLLGSTSNALDLSVIKAGTTTTLTRSATWIPKGQWVQWQATVSASGVPGSQITGNVTFKDGTRILATVALSNGTATFKSKSLAVGNHSVTVSYAGNSKLKASASKPLGTTVVAATRIDLMVIYTPAAVVDMGGLAGMAQRVTDSVWGTNTAFWNSRIPVIVKLVYSGQVNYAESGRLSTDLTRLAGTADGYMDNIHALRNQYKADLVDLFEFDGDAGGLGYELEDVSNPGNSQYGFSVSLAFQAAAPYYTLAHELGHNLGASHDKANAGSPGATSYSYGWRFMAGGVLYHDIMSYDPGQTIPYFSNPRVKYKGVPTGTATADSARTITFTAPYVAKYR